MTQPVPRLPVPNPPSTPYPEDRVWAEDQYRALRSQGLEPHTALSMIETLSKAQQHPLQSRDLLSWADADRWELAVRGERNQQTLLLPGLDPDALMRSLISQREQTFDVWQAATLEVQSPSRSPRAAIEYQVAVQSLRQIDDQIRQVTMDIARRYAEQMARAKWRDRLEEVRTALLTRYRVRGPQYEVLANQLAMAEVKMEMLAESPTPEDPREYATLATIVRTLTNQLQKYTESIKTEVIREEVNEAVVKVLTLVEHHVAPENPQMWKRLVDDIERRMGEPITDHEDEGEIIND